VMQSFDAGAYVPSVIRAHAERFDTQVFNREMTDYVERAWDAFHHKREFVWHNPGV
jgi:hypothetical protein